MTDGSRPPALSRLPFLDGLRAVAVLMVMAYHGGVAGLAVGGFYGVDVFFVLSGFLITTLLLGEQADTGRIAFRSFWVRRARRLLPGLLVMLVGVDLYVTFVAAPGLYPGFRGDALSVLGYVSNWHYIAAASNYFASTGQPSLLTHTWSLAIEEQFYLVWPLVLWGVARVARRLRRDPASGVLAVAAGGAALSAAWMAYLYRHGTGASRLYYGTDTHAQSILVGAALAACIIRRPRTASGPGWRSTLYTLVAAAVLGWAACTVGSGDPVAYQGGFLLVAGASAALIWHLTARPGNAPARLLSARPVAYVGRISYGMYLWYFPLFALINRSSTGLRGGPLFAVRAGADLAVAAASFHLVEQPVRRGRAWRPTGAGRWGALRPAALATFSVAAIACVISVGVPRVAPAAPVAASTAPAPAPEAGARPVRLLVVGDSTGMTLGMALSFPAVELRYGLVVDDEAQLGCGVAISRQLDGHGQPVSPPPLCNSASAAGAQWPALLRREVASFRPDVVLVGAGRWEVMSRRNGPGQPWLTITQPPDAGYVAAQLDQAVSIGLSAGARVALATAPCFSSGERPDGGAWAEDDPARVRAYNSIVGRVASEHPGGAFVVDMYALVCPSGRFQQAVGGVTVRAPDGIHYPIFNASAPARPDPDTAAQAEAFGEWVAPWIVAAMRRAGV